MSFAGIYVKYSSRELPDRGMPQACLVIPKRPAPPRTDTTSANMDSIAQITQIAARGAYFEQRYSISSIGS